MMIRILKLTISAAFFAVTETIRGFKRLLGLKNPPVCSILYYHGVKDDCRSGFARQMDDLLRYTTPIDLTQETQLQEGKHYSIVTFDDALLSVKRNAIPEMEVRKIPATIFVPTGYLGQKCTWMRVDEIKISQRDREQLENDRVMTAEELQQIDPEIFTLESHGVRHIHLTALDTEGAKAELTGSKTDLEQLLGREVTLFSLPRGEYSQAVVKLAREAGYRLLLTTEPKLAHLESNEFTIGRFSMQPDSWRMEFKLALMGAYRWMPVASKLKRSVKQLVGKR